MIPKAIPPSGPISSQDTKLWQAAQKMEANFLAEMLKSAGFGEARDSFGGGAGEDQFASFLRLEHAENMVDAGGIGLSERLFESLKERSNDT
ncbi:rod-binding protein [Actibacterium ureilyticum]|uniref:rod-binding protein n=1 Tax=Actibacterium ureilyticum TaxID=1590614 RepID=UPI000BAAD3E4|nr:rod-binding protein [Actibacterium ureilyticum]